MQLWALRDLSWVDHVCSIWTQLRDFPRRLGTKSVTGLAVAFYTMEDATQRRDAFRRCVAVGRAGCVRVKPHHATTSCRVSTTPAKLARLLLVFFESFRKLPDTNSVIINVCIAALWRSVRSLVATPHLVSLRYVGGGPTTEAGLPGSSRSA